MYGCKDCKERLYPFLDRELDEGEQVLVRQHLEVCGHCVMRFRFEGSVLRFVAEAARTTCCPEEARRRILRAFGREGVS